MCMFWIAVAVGFDIERLFCSDEVEKSSEIVSYEGLIMEPRVEGCSSIHKIVLSVCFLCLRKILTAHKSCVTTC